jgi:2-polyprenyl-3-methyl-5-hydroxy-6-metoxy-1,4-benzoquinol methylase
MSTDTVAAYDRLAPAFGKLAEQRKLYIDRIDQLVIAGVPARSRSMLDVGAGDGTRSRRIAARLGITELVLLEPSLGMQGAQATNTPIVTMRAEDLYRIQGSFDVITCLWNVLGHVTSRDARLEVLRQFARLLSPMGKAFVDLSHRYNARHYGVLPTALRYLHDLLPGSENNGDVVVSWDVEGSRCTTFGHVFTDREVRSLCRAAGLEIERTFAVDYATGELRRWNFEGHLLYQVAARGETDSLRSRLCNLSTAKSGN